MTDNERWGPNESQESISTQDGPDHPSMMMVLSESMWRPLAGWMVPLAMFLLVVSNVYHEVRIQPSAEVAALQLIDLESLSLVQSGTVERTEAPFGLSNLTIPAREIVAGGPPKDGIPALSNPKFIEGRHVRHVKPGDRVIGFVQGEDARAYPLKILNYHEIIKDQVGEVPIAITYCPLCDSAAAFDRRTPLGQREFGVSGLLYNSNVLMYDRAIGPESLWSQMKAEGVSGPASEKALKTLPIELTTWHDWRSRYPRTKVLSPDTGYARNYDRSPYDAYFLQPGLWFPVRPTSDDLPAKQRVLGVRTDTAARAYSTSQFSDDHRRVEDQLGGKRVVIESVPEADTLRVVEADEGVEWMYSLWFSWYAFHPDTELYGLSRE